MARSLFPELDCTNSHSRTVTHLHPSDTTVTHRPQKQVNPSDFSECSFDSVYSNHQLFKPTVVAPENVCSSPSSSPCASLDHFPTEKAVQKSAEDPISDRHSFRHDSSIESIECKHWLEVEDKYHRYGTYLRPYYDVWASLGSPGQFFHWLDYGDGRYIDLSQAYQTKTKFVSRSKLDHYMVHYCSFEERERFKVEVRDGILVWASKNPPHGAQQYDRVDSGGVSERWIFVIDNNGQFFINRKVKGRFHHSSFVAGDSLRAAGRIVINDGEIVCVGPNSGHYRTSKEQLEKALRAFFALPLNNISLNSVLLDADSMDHYYS